MSGGLRPPILKFSFQNPLSCNRKRHHTLCSNSTGCYVLGVSSGLATDRGGSDPGLCQGVISVNSIVSQLPMLMQFKLILSAYNCTLSFLFQAPSFFVF